MQKDRRTIMIWRHDIQTCTNTWLLGRGGMGVHAIGQDAPCYEVCG